MEFCDNCLVLTKNTICDYCKELDDETVKCFSTLFKQELINYLLETDSVSFAFSGGLDSVITLHELRKLTDDYNVELNLFTINHGYKGNKVKKNIRRVLEFENLKNNHEWININDKDKCIYTDMIVNKKLPCGKICNDILDNYYKKYLKQNSNNLLITGGDTPKFNESLKRYSIFWKKRDYCVLRGSAALGLTKEKIKNIKNEERIPWEDPMCGGYDTDCLIPGFILRNIYGKSKLTLKQINKSLPIVINYFSERIRWGIIKKENAIKRIINVEVSDDICYNEMTEMMKNYYY